MNENKYKTNELCELQSINSNELYFLINEKSTYKYV